MWVILALFEAARLHRILVALPWAAVATRGMRRCRESVRYLRRHVEVVRCRMGMDPSQHCVASGRRVRRAQPAERAYPTFAAARRHANTGRSASEVWSSGRLLAMMEGYVGEE